MTKHDIHRGTPTRGRKDMIKDSARFWGGSDDDCSRLVSATLYFYLVFFFFPFFAIILERSAIPDTA